MSHVNIKESAEGVLNSFETGLETFKGTRIEAKI